MASINLKYGRIGIPVEFDASRFDVLGTDCTKLPMSDKSIGDRLDGPIDSPPLEDVVRPGETVLLVVPDATRDVGAGQIVNLVVRRLIANGTVPHEIAAIFSTGIHRAVTESEKEQILTPFIKRRVVSHTHDAGDPIRNFRLGATESGIAVELDWRLTEYDHVVLVGGVTFHYFAGFTGGRKLICPGLASSKTVAETHRLAFDCAATNRRAGVGTAKLDGNVVHESFVEAAALAKPAFCLSTITNEKGEIVDLFCGDWQTSHRAACDAYAAEHSVKIEKRRPVVIASCGGRPHDINLIQAHKTLEAASHACEPGGSIYLVAECGDGAGNPDFFDWLETGGSDDIAARLCTDYQVNGQTAWSLSKLTSIFNVSLFSEITDSKIANMRNRPFREAADSIKAALTADCGYIWPSGAKFTVEGV